jgi:hypothetical protein
MVLLLGVTTLRECRDAAHRGVYIFSIRDGTAIGFVKGRQAVVYGDFNPENPGMEPLRCNPGNLQEELPYELRGFFSHYKLRLMSGREFPWRRSIHSPVMDAEWFAYLGMRMLVISTWDERDPEDMPVLDAGIVLIRNNSRVSVPLICSMFRPSLIVSDGSNYPWHEERIESECAAEGVVFHSIRRDGCLIY